MGVRDTTTEQTVSKAGLCPSGKEGVDSDTLAMMALYRSEIPTRTSRNMQKWISIVKSGREATAGMLEGKIPAAKLADMMDSKPGLRSMSDTRKLLRTLSALQIDKASGYRVRSGVYSFVGENVTIRRK